MNAVLQWRVVLVGAAALVAAACGVDLRGPQPSALTIPTPFVERLANVEGQWVGPATLLPVEGTLTGLGECVQADLNQRLATGVVSTDIILSLAQSHSDVTGRLTATGTGQACTYTGKAAANDVVLDASSCEARPIVVRCSDGNVRDLMLLDSVVTARVEPFSTAQARTLSGTVTNTYNVLVSGEPKGVGGVVLRYNYTARRQ